MQNGQTAQKRQMRMSEEKDLKGQDENRETDAGFESKGQEMPGTAGQNERTPGKRKGWRKQTADPKKAGEEKDTAASPGGPLVREKARWRVIRFMLYFLMMFMLIAGLSAKWVTDEWGDLSLDEVMFTITQPLKGTDSGIIWGYIGYCIVGPVVLLAVLLAIYHLFLMPKQPPKGKKQKKDGKAIRAAAELSSEKEEVIRKDYAKKNTKARRLIRRFLLPAVTVAAVVFGSIQIGRIWNKLGIGQRIASMGEKSTYIEDNYVDPATTTLTFPEKKRNLIYIFLESMEMSYSDRDSGGLFDESLIPELTELAKDTNNIDFAGKDQSTKLDGGNALKYSTWTMAGMWAATSGLPLKIPIEINGVGTNFMNTQDSFFPNLTCLGDILSKEGYTMEMMFGSDATFGGRRLCFTEHGNFNFDDWKLYTTNGTLPSDYKVWWGFEDTKLFEYAKNKLTELGNSGKPFDFTMLTVDTHYPEGYKDTGYEEVFPDQYKNVIHLSDKQVAEFVKWIQQQDWYDNTTVVISGDHPTMNKEICAGASYDYRRKVYTCYLNSAVKPVRDDYREFATIDNFPTTLAALGVKIDGDRLGMGTNLFSDKDTLIEKDGLDYVNTELMKSSDWMDEQSNLKKVTADIHYGEYDPETSTITYTIDNVTSDKVEGFRASLHMYGYTVNGSDYVSWTDSTEIKPGVFQIVIKIPTEQAFDGRIKIQPHCMIDGVRGIHIDTHYYHLKYDAGGGNAESYQCDKYGAELKPDAWYKRAFDWAKGLFSKN